MAERFLKPCNELSIDVESMPVKNERMKIAVALWHCRSNGPIPGEFLQVGMAILRQLSLDKLADDESPPFWVFVGFLEWVNTCSPAGDAIAQILRDLRQYYLLTPSVLKNLLQKVEKKIPELKMAAMRVSVVT